ncbi:ThiF family adenylyltransferase [Shewanella hafniensis]|uniref:ThiF family adenylyltransferase n=1 Tax=Shewanella hafniensis TaxID=365590 RepID=UPI0035715527
MLGIHGGKLPMNTERPAFVWTIAGSDSGGGAGIQADLATIQDLGCHGCSVITTVTAQSSVAVTLVEPVSAAMLMAQLTTLLSDLPPKAIKIGLLADQSQVALLADWIASFKIHYPSVPVIVDPVMVASCGDALAVDNCQDIKSAAKSALDFNPFKGLIELITPNVLELGRLTQSDVSTKAQFATAAQALSQSLDCSVLAKGGDVSFGSTDILDDTHAKTQAHIITLDSNGWDLELAEDYLVCHRVRASSELHQNARFWLASQRVNTRHNHGSGCTLSSAIAAVLAQGFVLQDAVVVAKAYVSQGLSAAIGLGQGPGPLARTGWPNDLSRYAKIRLCDGNFISYHLNQHLDVGNDLVATVFSATDQATAQVRITSTPAQYISSHGFKVLDADLGVYPVVSDLIMLESLLVAGVKTVQLRIKTDTSGSTAAGLAESDSGKSALGRCESGKSKSGEPELIGSELEAKIQTAIALGKHFNAQLFINDHWQLAIKHHAFGVHLGQEDLAVADLAAIQAAGLALGISSHSYFELLLAHQYSPSYIALGHIFPTTTKQMPSAPQGLAKLTHYVALLKDHYPLVAIGGIDLDNLAKVKATGVANIAVVRAITEAQDPVAAFAVLSQAWEPYWGAKCMPNMSTNKPLYHGETVSGKTLSDADFMRYSRQVLLPEVGEAGQWQLADASVVIVGLGGLGQLAAQYLACAGIGNLILIDMDKVEVSNLPRQLLFSDGDIGLNKARVAKQKLNDLAPQCTVTAHETAFNTETAAHHFAGIFQAKQQGKNVLVLDCTDNFATRQAINRSCIEAALPLVSASIAAFSGQLFAVDQMLFPSGGCYHCIFPAQTRVPQSCSSQGVLGPSVGVMASMQSLVAMQLLLSVDIGRVAPRNTLLGRFWRFDAKSLTWTAAALTRDPHCDVCGPKEVHPSTKMYCFEV